jgi:16S rRNA (uracil1498-N3)-methyltransferase
MPRFYCPTPLTPGALLDLPAGAARHVQVLRLQPGDGITLFTGDSSGEFNATVTQMGRSSVQVQVGDFVATQREPGLRVHLAVGMPANERMDWLVEKATELGVASIQPLTTERSVLRLSGERADKKIAHWHSVAVAACEQCGGNQVPVIHPVKTLAQWLVSHVEHVRTTSTDKRPLGLLLSLKTGTHGVRDTVARLTADRVVPGSETSASAVDISFVSGPEGGLSPAEEQGALAAGLVPVTLGSRVLRAETAALAALAALLV